MMRKSRFWIAGILLGFGMGMAFGEDLFRARSIVLCSCAALLVNGTAARTCARDRAPALNLTGAGSAPPG